MDERCPPSPRPSHPSRDYLVTRGELYDNLNKMSISVGSFFNKANVAIGHLSTFAEKVARDPSAMTRGALRPQ